MEKAAIDRLVSDLIRKIRNEYKHNRINAALDLLSLCSIVLYTANQHYRDTELEEILKRISSDLTDRSLISVAQYAPNPDTVVFFDGFGLDTRGLAQIYITALCRTKKVIYITYETQKDRIPTILHILKSSGGEVFFLPENNKLSQIKQITEIINTCKPVHYFQYSVPYDVVSTAVMYACRGKLSRILIDLNDHTFWLGADSFDVCIEFRNYGASIAKEYRNIEEDRISILPFYPIIDHDQAFLGFPFQVQPDQKVVFSGGALYKTMGGGDKYYKIVEHLLEQYPHVIFWYAGSGDSSKIEKIKSRFPERVFLTAERKDLFQVLQQCHFYLSTYPVCGGLMYQYAASAGKIPLTLRHSNINDGMLQNQESLAVDFHTLQELESELNRIMSDEDYVKSREAILKDSVITQECFQTNLERIMKMEPSDFPAVYEHLNTDDFRRVYLETLSEPNLNEMFVRRESWQTIARCFPKRFFLGVLFKFQTKWEKLSKKA